MRIVNQIGNTTLLKRGKTLFICSKHTPIGCYGRVFAWVDSLTAEDCVVCFDTTEMEREVMRTLLVRRIPTILLVMNRFRDVNNMQVELALAEQRMLILTVRREQEDKGLTSMLRNRMALDMVQQVVCGYVNPKGTIAPLLKGRKEVVSLIECSPLLLAADTDEHPYRWTLAEDKKLLRLFYEDVGIHVMHQNIGRSYAAIRRRIGTMTMSDEYLKGREFEDYVLDLFHVGEEGKPMLKEWRGDKTHGDIAPENNSLPDFIFEYQGCSFAVECKWRNHLDMAHLIAQEHVASYKQFAKENNMPVHIILVIGGEPCNPQLLYDIPIGQLDEVLAKKIPINTFQQIPTDRGISVNLKFISKQKAKNAYAPWTEEEESRLADANTKGMSIAALAAQFGRTTGAIRARLKKQNESGSK